MNSTGVHVYGGVAGIVVAVLIAAAIIGWLVVKVINRPRE